MFDLKSIGDEASREMLERYMHETLSGSIKDAIANGDNAHNVVVKALTRVRDSKLLKMVHETLGPKAVGLGLTGLGAGIAEWLKTRDWGNFMPEEKSPIMREVRYVLQIVVPSLIVGGVEGVSDTFEDDVKSAVGKVVSNTSRDAPTTPGICDHVYEILSADGIDYVEKYGLLFPEWDADGKEQKDDFGSTILLGRMGKKFYDDWYATHKGEWRDVPVETPANNNQQGGNGNNRGGQNNNQPRTKRTWFEAQPYKGRLVPLAVAILRMPVTAPMDPELVALAKAALTPKDPKEKKADVLSENGQKFTFLWTRSMVGKPEHEQREARDLLSDIVSNVAHINRLGDEFVARAAMRRDGKLTDDDVKSVLEYVQTWMGATLTIKNEFLRGLDRAMHVFETAKHPTTGALLNVGERFEKALGAFGHMVGKYTLGSAVFMVALFATLLGMVVVGAFGVSLDDPNAISSALTNALGVTISHTMHTSRLEVLYFMPAVLFFALAWYLEGWLRFLFLILGIMTGIPATVFVTADVMQKLEPHEFATILVFGAGFLACIELFTLTTIQGVLSVVTRFFPNVEKDWLVNKGRILVMFIAIHVGIFMILLSVQTPWLLRVVICASTMFALASQMGLSAYDFGAEARLRNRRTMRLFSTLTTIVFVAVIVVLVFQLNGIPTASVKGVVAGSRILQSVLILMIVSYPIAWAVRRVETVYTKLRYGVLRDVEWETIWPARVTGLLLALFLASWPWIGSDINAHFEKKSAESAETKPAPEPVAVPQVVQSVVAPSAPTAQKASAGSRKKARSQAPSEGNCDGYTFGQRQDLNNCQ